jgi:predicted transcriptional regulator
MRARTTTAKDEVIDMLRRLPDDATFDDIEYHVSVLAGIHRGLRAVEEGRTVTHAEVVRMMDEWPDP